MLTADDERTEKKFEICFEKRDIWINSSQAAADDE